MNERTLTIGAGIAVALILLNVALNSAVPPTDRVMNDIDRAIEDIPEQIRQQRAANEDFERMSQAFQAKPGLWEALVPPAPPPKPAPPPAPDAPDVRAMLKSIHVSRAQIGDSKVKVFGPKFPDGAWIEIGDAINGCTLESFTRDEAVFAYDWRDGGKVLRAAVPRE